MASIASHLPVSKSSHRLKPTGLKVKTSFAEPGRYVNGRAKAIRAADWRNPTAMASLSEDSRIKYGSSEGRREPRTSSDMSSPLLIEIDDIDRGPVRYRRPNNDQTPWEMISSAPVAESRLTQSELLDLCLADITNVEFKDVKPVVVNVNGEKIVLPNRFTFDITPINLSESCLRDSFSGTIGQMKRVQDSSQLSTKSSERSTLFSELPDDLRALLTHDLRTIIEEPPPSPVRNTHHSTENVAGRKGSPPNIVKPVTTTKPLIKENPQHRCSKLTDEDKARFQGLLNRLHKKELSAGKPTMSAFDVRSSDPAILAAKVKEDTVTIRSLRNNESKTEILESVRLPRVAGLRRSENSRDSGYGTGPSSHSADDHPALPQDPAPTLRPIHQDNTKKLNPAAAEFKSTGETMDMPFLVPKRLSRPPLTEYLFDAPAVTPAQPISTPVCPPRGFGPLPSDNITAHIELPLQPGPPSHGNVQPENMPGPALLHPPPLGLLDPRTSEVSPLPGMLPGPLSGVYPAADALSRTFNINSTVAYSTMPPAVPGHTNGFGTVSTASFNHFPIPTPQMGLPNINPFGTFPPTDVALPFGPVTPGFSRNVALPGPPRSGFIPVPGDRQPPLFGADVKAIRPHFPVTQKPRDHDPVKQQQYEAYLEWRKANEPGYHIRCKMRQANRIVRQHQMKQAEQKQAEQKGIAKADEKPENPAWKSIVEKAKAVVANAAAAAAAEKRSRGESVKEEFRTKIKESCSDLLNLGQQEPEKQPEEVQDVDGKKEQN